MTAGHTYAEAIRLVLDSRIADIHTAMPGEVVSYDATKQVADVQPQIKRVVEGVEATAAEQLPVLPSVPVIFPQGGGYFMSFPLQPGDHVLLLFCESAIDQWRAKGRVTDPGDLRHHSLSSAVAYAGFETTANALSSAHASNMVLGKDGGQTIHVDSLGVKIGGADADEWMVMGSTLKGFLDLVYFFMNVFITWVPVPNDGGAALKALITSNFPTGAPQVPADLLSTKHKIKD